MPSGSLASLPENKFTDTYKEGDIIFKETFEDDISDNWEIREKAVVEVRDNIVKDGKKSLYVNDDSDTLSGGLSSISYPVSAGVIYSVTADVYNEVGQLSIYMKFFDVIGETVGSISKSISAPEIWNTFVMNYKAPENAVAVQVWVHTSDSTKRAGYVDNVTLKKGGTDEAVPETPYIEPKQVPAVAASIVTPVDNKLVYKEYTDKGDKLGDFSYGGYYAGEYELPVTENLPIALTLSPTGTYDDTQMLQDAIDKVFSESTDTKMKVIKLKAGTYNINKTGIDLKSGILLSGEGQGPTGTILYAKDPVNHFVLRIYGEEPQKCGENAVITDEYLPAGSKLLMFLWRILKILK